MLAGWGIVDAMKSLAVGYTGEVLAVHIGIHSGPVVVGQMGRGPHSETLAKVTSFVRDARGVDRALGISIGHLENGAWSHVVLTPADGDGWTLAKYFVLQGAGHVTTLAGHPATHFPFDTVNAITKSAVPMRHTLFKLMLPHMRLALAVDNAVLEGGNSVVSETRGEFCAPCESDRSQVRVLVAAAYVGYPHPLSPYARNQPPDPNDPPWADPPTPRRTPFRIRLAPPRSREVPGFSRRKVLRGWDRFKSTLAFEMFFRPHNVVLLKDVDDGFTQPELQQAAARFAQALAQTERDLIHDGVDVDKYLPLSQIATSIQS